MKETYPKINYQLCGHEGENFFLLPSLLLQNWSPTPPLGGNPAEIKHILVRTAQNHDMCELPVLIQPQITV